MGKVYEDYPEDGEAAAFYALSLISIPARGDADRADREKAIAILNKLFAAKPDHPGAAHYLIHACDTPELASQGLEAARSYAKIAPDSSHALHMPSHIFYAARPVAGVNRLESGRDSVEVRQLYRRSAEVHGAPIAHSAANQDPSYALTLIGGGLSDPVSTRFPVPPRKGCGPGPDAAQYVAISVISIPKSLPLPSCETSTLNPVSAGSTRLTVRVPRNPPTLFAKHDSPSALRFRWCTAYMGCCREFPLSIFVRPIHTA